MIKKLTIDCLEDVKRIIPQGKIDEFKETYLSDLVTWYAYGYYDEQNVLKGVSCTYFSGDEPEWVLLDQYCDDADDQLIMIDEVCAKFEKHGIYRFSWLDLDYSMDYMKNFIPERYLSFMDYATDAWLKPRYKKHSGTLYSSGWHPVKSTVNFSILENKYRKL
jgi:hypothetical protein